MRECCARAEKVPDAIGAPQGAERRGCRCPREVAERAALCCARHNAARSCASVSAATPSATTVPHEAAEKTDAVRTDHFAQVTECACDVRFRCVPLNLNVEAVASARLRETRPRESEGLNLVEINPVRLGGSFKL